METTPTRTTRRSSTVLVGAGAFAGAAAVLLLGAAFTQDPQPARPAGRIKPTPEQVTAETDAAMKVLNQFVGRWDVKGQSFDENDKPVEDFAGSAHYTFVLSENFLMGETTLQAGKYVLDQKEYFGYSPGLDKYTHVVLTELDKSMIYQHGEWMAEVGSFVFAMAAPLDTPRGTPRSVGYEYTFGQGTIAITMTMQSGVKQPRHIRMLLTKSKQPDAPRNENGMPTGSPKIQYARGDPAKIQQQMQESMSQMSAQKQAMAQYINGMDMGWDAEMDHYMDMKMDQEVGNETRELMRGPE